MGRVLGLGSEKQMKVWSPHPQHSAMGKVAKLSLIFFPSFSLTPLLPSQAQLSIL
jgi:hypothetical protein